MSACQLLTSAKLMRRFGNSATFWSVVGLGGATSHTTPSALGYRCHTKIICSASISALLAGRGAQVVSEDLGMKLEGVEIGQLGRAKKVSISKDDTIILDGGGDKGAIEDRCEQIRQASTQSTSDYDRCSGVHRQPKHALGQTACWAGTQNCQTIDLLPAGPCLCAVAEPVGAWVLARASVAQRHSVMAHLSKST